MKKEVMIVFSLVILVSFMQLASAGVGIKWDKESVVVSEGEKTCLTYSVYNPWPEDSYVIIELPDELKGVLTSQEAEKKLIPANTASKNAIPVNFCFKIPQIYKEECLIAGLLCKQECKEELKVYEGDVSVKSVPGATELSGSGGSTTSMSVAAPLRLRVQCNAHGTDFTLIYVLIALISAIAIAYILYRKYRKPESERKKEKLVQLKEEMKKLKQKSAKSS